MSIGFGLPQSRLSGIPSPEEQYWLEQQQRIEDDIRRQQAEAWGMQQTVLGLENQQANLAYGNAQQRIANRNALANARGNLASTQYGLGQQILQSEAGLDRGLTDLEQQKLSNYRYGLGLEMDLARQRGQEQLGVGSRVADFFR